jgi:hypothetical protein
MSEETSFDDFECGDRPLTGCKVQKEIKGQRIN